MHEKQRLPRPNHEGRITHAAKTVGHLLSGPHELAKTGQHTFPNNHPDFRPTVEDLMGIPRPTHFDEFYGEVFRDVPLGPQFYDRQGYPIWEPTDLL